MTTDPAGRATDLLLDAFARVAEELPGLLEGLRGDEIDYQPDLEANSLGWMVWHLARVEDDHLAGVAGTAQVWTEQGWARRFALPYPEDDIGYGHSPSDVAAFSVLDIHLLSGYYAAVHARTREIVSGLSDADFDRIVDRRFDPPVTAAVRLVSVVNDVSQHLGRVAYLRGLVMRRR